MQRMQDLRKQKKQLREYKRTLDKDAPFSTEEGARYARVLTKLVLIELELEEMEKTALQSGLR
ncbi:hypothetical protein GE107_01575 [Cohnella sp. CFH 77786]|uniref:hypothetical protein n=1 Tax=Cohnella sp. CFH 77786 TaxID=2662265 RepID=UPI001C60A9D2|nr:hypothetical protein [Cohnella sp. CFH 77786]MBW5444755.1 hypothetical protein [Cohnella sp. CFH 77786]